VPSGLSASQTTIDGGARISEEKSAVAVERRERLLLITINRPEQRNAINAAVARGIADALDQLDADDGLSAGILTGAGKGFCAGMDLKAFVQGNVPHAGALALTGDPITAERAYQLGLVNRLTVAAVARSTVAERVNELSEPWRRARPCPMLKRVHGEVQHEAALYAIVKSE
jgi:enoyl-CoA hydratase/carnithine racemase